MESLLSALAFAGLIAAQFLSVVLVNTRSEGPSPGTRDRSMRKATLSQHLGDDPARSAPEGIPLSQTAHYPAQGLLEESSGNATH
jgi:hypothetical protein